MACGSGTAIKSDGILEDQYCRHCEFSEAISCTVNDMIRTNIFQFNLCHFRQQFGGSSLLPGDLVCAIGNYFLDAPYQPDTLESGLKEKMIVNFAQFDCFTFLETVLALTECVYAGKISKAEFRRLLQLIRYRSGIIDGYSSRLHYFTDWLRDNELKGMLRDVSRQLGAVISRKKINYMTEHRKSYSGLQNENEFQKMRRIEQNISRRVFRVISKDKVNRQIGKIKSGDIIAFAAEKEGLDVAHAGFALWRGKKLYLLHASSLEGAVVVSQKTLISYLKQNRNFTGIIVCTNRYMT